MDTNPEVEVTEQSPEDDLLASLQTETEEVETDQSEETAETEQVEEEATPELEEVEYEGEKVKVPPKVAEALKKADSFQSDYTRKTQELASIRKIVEDKSQFLEAQEMLYQHAFTEAAEVQALQGQLKQYDSLDWNALIAEDAQKAFQLQVSRNTLQSQLQEKQGRLSQVAQAAQQARAQHLRQQMELGQQEMQRRVGKLTDQQRQDLIATAREYGMEERHLMDPVVIHALADAAKWRSVQKSKPQAMRKVQEAPKAVRPSAPQPRGENQEAAKRLKATGRPEHLMKFL